MDSRGKRQVLETPKIGILKYHTTWPQNYLGIKNKNQTDHSMFLFPVLTLIIAGIPP